MPTTSNPPVAEPDIHRLPPREQDRPREQDLPRENDNGNGRIPPPEKHTGGPGGGDEDHWASRPVGSRGPRERLMHFRIGIACVIGAVTLLFVALFVAFFTTKTNIHVDAYDRVINDWLPTPIPSILWLNTAVLLLSSVTAECARHSMFSHRRRDG